MNGKFWSDSYWQDSAVPVEDVSDEEIYTLRLSDFLEMPEVNFEDLIPLDPHLRALLN